MFDFSQGWSKERRAGGLDYEGKYKFSSDWLANERRSLEKGGGW
jgi:hypothetical protein